MIYFYIKLRMYKLRKKFKSSTKKPNNKYSTYLHNNNLI